MLLKKYIRIVLLIAALIFIVLGLMSNGFDEVRSEAVMICMECIGIG